MMHPEFSTVIDGRIVVVEKVGGGTLGRRYDGRWNIEIYDYTGEGELTRVYETDYNSYTDHTHRSVAREGHKAMMYIED
jgi:hypothetical protein